MYSIMCTAQAVLVEKGPSNLLLKVCYENGVKVAEVVESSSGYLLSEVIQEKARFNGKS
jgi:hypothetical protein